MPPIKYSNHQRGKTALSPVRPVCALRSALSHDAKKSARQICQKAALDGLPFYCDSIPRQKADISRARSTPPKWRQSRSCWPRAQEMRRRETHPFGILPFCAVSGACGSLSRGTDAKMRLYLANMERFYHPPARPVNTTVPATAKSPGSGAPQKGARFSNKVLYKPQDMLYNNPCVWGISSAG